MPEPVLSPAGVKAVDARLEKAGLLLEGRMRSHLLARGEWRDSLLWAALDTDPRGARH